MATINNAVYDPEEYMDYLKKSSESAKQTADTAYKSSVLEAQKTEKQMLLVHMRL